MPFSLAWHDTLPVLIVTYQGTLTLREYKQLCTERATWLKNGPDKVIIVADMRHFESFPEATALTTRDYPRMPETVQSTLIVLESAEYRPLFRATTARLDQHLAVYFFSSQDEALNAVPRLLA